MRKHNERCKDCKKRISELLEIIYGKSNVYQNYNLGFSNKVEEFEDNYFNSNLKTILSELKKFRGYENFIRSKKLPNVDYFIKNNFVLEFDESQHFTKPRLISLDNYSEKLLLGFDKVKWLENCEKLDKKDNDPPFRDEQRAWYDTIRDFIPFYLNLKPTIRLYANDYVWCSLNVNKNDDIEIFKKIINYENYK